MESELISQSYHDHSKASKPEGLKRAGESLDGAPPTKVMKKSTTEVEKLRKELAAKDEVMQKKLAAKAAEMSKKLAAKDRIISAVTGRNKHLLSAIQAAYTEVSNLAMENERLAGKLKRMKEDRAEEEGGYVSPDDYDGMDGYDGQLASVSDDEDDEIL